MSASTAAAYADQLEASIRQRVESGAPFGYVNTYDDSTAETVEEIEGYDADEHDADNLPENWEAADGYVYLRDVLDIRFIVGSDRTYKDAQICITLGGPNVWIHTQDHTLNVHWGFETAVRKLPGSYIDLLDDAAQELWDIDS